MLAGRTGECPKCKTKFRITASDQQARRQPGDEDDISLEDIEEIDLAPSSAHQSPARSQIVPAVPSEPLSQSTNSIFATLWNEREHGGIVELHLDSDTTLVPNWWSPAHSTDVYGLFALQCDVETYEIHAVAWAHVRRITVRKLTELPGGIFEGT